MTAAELLAKASEASGAAAMSRHMAESIIVARDPDDPWAEDYASQRRDAHREMADAHVEAAGHYSAAWRSEVAHERAEVAAARDAGEMGPGWLGALAGGLIGWGCIVVAIMRVTA